MTPSDAAWRQLISTVQASGRKAALAITGGGSGAIGELLRIPGGSRLLVEAQVPYDEMALQSFLGFAPAQACAADTAVAMAQSARARAAGLVPSGTDTVGLGATAALVSDRPRRGEHRFHIAYANAAGSRTAPACWPRDGGIAPPRKSLCRARSCYGWPAPAGSPRRRRAACSIRTNIMPRPRSPPAMRSIGSWRANSIASPSSPTARGCCRRRPLGAVPRFLQPDA